MMRRRAPAAPPPKKHAVAASTRFNYWEEREIDHWIDCQVRGVAWTPLPPAAPGEPRKLLTGPKVLEKTALSNTLRWRMEKAGRFPPAIKLISSIGVWPGQAADGEAA